MENPHPFPEPDLMHYSLIGRIGNGPAFLVGRSYDKPAGEDGELQLGVNDENLPDNDDGWTAIIYQEKEPLVQVMLLYIGEILTG